MEPRKHRNFTLIGTLATLLLIAAVILGIGYLLSGSFPGMSSGESSSRVTVSGAGIHSIRIDYPRGSVELVSAAGSSIVLSEELKSEAEPVSHSQENGTLTIRGGDTMPGRMLPFGGERARLVLEVPESLMRDFDLLEIRTANGKISAEEIGGDMIIFESASGSIEDTTADAREIRYRTSSGSIRGLNAAGDSVTLESNSGNIEGNHVQAQDLTAKTSSGQIRDFAFNADRQSLETSSGTVRDGEVDSEEIVIKTSSGSIRDLSLTAQRADLSTSSGSIDLHLETAVSHIQSNSGSINVTFTEQMTWAGIRTGSGRIRVDAPFDVDIMAGSETVDQEAGNPGRKTLAVTSNSGQIEINGLDMKEIDLEWK